MLNLRALREYAILLVWPFVVLVVIVAGAIWLQGEYEAQVEKTKRTLVASVAREVSGRVAEAIMLNQDSEAQRAIEEKVGSFGIEKIEVIADTGTLVAAVGGTASNKAVETMTVPIRQEGMRGDIPVANMRLWFQFEEERALIERSQKVMAAVALAMTVIFLLAVLRRKSRDEAFIGRVIELLDDTAGRSADEEEKEEVRQIATLLTESKISKREYKQVAKRLEKMLAERMNRAMKAAEIETRERENANIRNYYSEWAHDTRTPTGQLINLTSVLEQADLSKPEEIRQDLQYLKRLGTSIMQQFDDVLELAVIEAGEIDRSEEHHDVLLEVDDLLDGLATETWLAHKIAVEYDVSDRVPLRGMINRQALRKSVRNVVNNAAKHSREGFAVKVQVTFIDAMLKIVVMDAGDGIAEENHERIFDYGARVSGKKSGTGLGLHNSRRRVEAVGGALNLVQSKLGAGSTFEIDLPVRNPEWGQMEMNMSAHECWVIHEDPKIREAVTRLAKRLDFANVLSVYPKTAIIQQIPESTRPLVVLAGGVGARFMAQAADVLLNAPEAIFCLMDETNQSSSVIRQDFWARRWNSVTLNKIIESVRTGEVLQRRITGRILVVDDDPTNLMLIRRKMIDHHGVGPGCIETETSPLRAIEKARDEEFSAAILDWRMEEMDGVELAKRLREIRPEIVMAGQSASLEPNLKERWKQVGVEHFWPKTTDRAEVDQFLDLFTTEKRTEAAAVLTATRSPTTEGSATGGSTGTVEESSFDQAITARVQEAKANLERWIDEGNREQILEEAHSAKGVCGLAGRLEDKALFAEIERHATNNQLSEAKEVLTSGVRYASTDE